MKDERRRKRELKRRKIVSGLLMTVAVAVSMLIAMPVSGATPNFTGNVESDFQDTDPSIRIVVDPTDIPLLVPGHPVTNTRSGWDIKDLRLTYGPSSDTLYVGLNSYETIGDVDSNGNEGPPASYGGGNDIVNLGGTETVSVYFDFDQDGNWDVIVGVADNVDFSGFTMKTAVQGLTPGDPPSFGTIDRTTYLGPTVWKPDLEFQIQGFSIIPGQDGDLGAFNVGAFMGSLADGTIGEDSMVGSVSLPTPPPPVGGMAFPVNKLGLLAPWALVLGCAGVVTLLMLRRRRQA
jgi:hypothetical protein